MLLNLPAIPKIWLYIGFIASSFTHVAMHTYSNHNKAYNNNTMYSITKLLTVTYDHIVLSCIVYYIHMFLYFIHDHALLSFQFGYPS